ncbi:MAG: hypothetical protein GY925_23370, partial [Actinomycetia bacterium]|nr:hypothetical protein [Actinomycetes bacterium]
MATEELFGRRANVSSRIALKLLVGILVASVLAPLGAAPARAAGSGRIEGVVVAASTGEPVVGATVRATGTGLGEAISDPDGRFVIDGLVAGHYYVEIAADGFAPEVYPDAPQPASGGEKIQIADGETRTIEVRLDPGGTITGRLTDSATGEPIAAVAVTAVQATITVLTDADGRYTIEHLAPLQYLVRFKVSETYRDEYYLDAHHHTAASPVDVVDSEVTVVDAELDIGAVITGTVTHAETGVPLGGIHVETTFRSAVTAPDGTYTLSGLNPTTTFPYAVQVTDPTQAHAPQEQRSVETALDAPTTLDFALSESVGVAGTVRNAAGEPVEGVTVQASGVGFGRLQKAESAADGSYLIEGLAPGNYRLRAQAHREYGDTWWPGTQTAPPVGNLALEDGVSTDIDLVLSRLGSISGTVTDPSGTPLAGIRISAVDPTEHTQRSATTDASGRFDIFGLYTGQYHVKFLDDQGDWATAFYPGVRTQSEGTSISLVTGDAVDGTDITLVDAASIGGTVTSSEGTLAGPVDIKVIDPSGEILSTERVYADGPFEMGSLFPGDILVHFEAPTPHFAQWFDSAVRKDDATNITLAAGEHHNIDAILRPGATVSGTVIQPDGTPVEQPVVTVRSTVDGRTWVREGEADGTYVVDAIPPGPYVVSARGGGALSETFHPDAKYSETATVVNVDQTLGDLANVDITMQKAAGIGGRVVDQFDDPIGGANVRVHGPVFIDTLTNSDGTFAFHGLGAWDWNVVAWLGDAVSGPNDPVSVADDFIDGLELTLELAPVITGHLVDESGNGIAGVEARLFRSDGIPTNWTTTTALDGRFIIHTEGVPDGPYTLYFQDEEHRFRSMWLGGATVWQNYPDTTVDQAQMFDLTRHRFHFDVTMVPRGIVSGAVTDVHGDPVQGIVVRWLGSSLALGKSSQTGPDGNYEIDWVDNGDFTLMFDSPDGEYVDTFYDSVTSAPDATKLEIVEPGGRLDGIDQQIDRMPSVSGVVVGPDGSPLSGIEVEVGSKTAMTDQDGSYTVIGVSPGSRPVRFSDPLRHYAPEWFDQVVDRADSTGFDLGLNDRLTDIDAQLAVGAKIVGTVTDADGQPIPEALITAYNETSVTADENGYYEVTGLATGSYGLDSRAEGYSHNLEHSVNVSVGQT